MDSNADLFNSGTRPVTVASFTRQQEKQFAKIFSWDANGLHAKRLVAGLKKGRMNAKLGPRNFRRREKWAALIRR